MHQSYLHLRVLCGIPSQQPVVIYLWMLDGRYHIWHMNNSSVCSVSYRPAISLVYLNVARPPHLLQYKQTLHRSICSVSVTRNYVLPRVKNWNECWQAYCLCNCVRNSLSCFFLVSDEHKSSILILTFHKYISILV